MPNPDISIVVCTKNRASLLAGALASLYDLATEDEFTYEIVVIDNGSTDETQQVISAAAAQSKHPLRGVLEREAGIVAARNRGIRESRGRWIAFFDDDQIADWHWLAELHRGAEERKCRVVGGAVQLALPADCKRQLATTVRMLLGEPLGGDLPQRYGGRLTPGCGNLLVHQSVFDEVGIFLTAIDGRGEDTDLFERIQRAGIEAWYLPTAIIHHLTPPERLEREYLLNLATRMGRGIALRQRKALGFVRFAPAWTMKLVRMLAIDYPRLMLAGLRRNDEATLGRRVQLTISQAYLCGKCATVAPEKPAVQPRPAHSAASGESESTSPKPQPAPVFAIGGSEPTAVMEFPAFSVGASSPTVPSQR